MAPSGAHYGEGAAAANGGLTLRDPVTGAQYVQIQLLQVRSPDMIVCFPRPDVAGSCYYLTIK